MKKVKVEMTTRLTIEGPIAFMERRVTPFGTGAKVDCPKRYLGKSVYLVVCRE